jgi:hypothetical protein
VGNSPLSLIISRLDKLLTTNQPMMALSVGQTFRDARWNYLHVEALGNHTVLSDVFKAEIILRV